VADEPTDEEVAQYELLRKAALTLIEYRLRSGKTEEQILEELRPMLDEDIDEF
jgi:hypothetical protein